MLGHWNTERKILDYGILLKQVSHNMIPWKVLKISYLMVILCQLTLYGKWTTRLWQIVSDTIIVNPGVG